LLNHYLPSTLYFLLTKLSFILPHGVNRTFSFLSPRRDFPNLFKYLISAAPLFCLNCQVVLEPPHLFSGLSVKLPAHRAGLHG